MSYYKYKFKKVPTDQDESVEIFMDSAHHLGFEEIARNEDYSVEWINGKENFNINVEFEKMRVHLMEHQNYYKYSHEWWKDTAISRLGKKFRCRYFADQIYKSIKYGKYDIDDKMTAKNIKKGKRVIIYSVRDIYDNGKTVKVLFNTSEMSVIERKGNEVGYRIEQIKSSLKKLDDLIKNKNTSSNTEISSKAEKTVNYDDKSYIDLE